MKTKIFVWFFVLFIVVDLGLLGYFFYVNKKNSQSLTAKTGTKDQTPSTSTTSEKLTVVIPTVVKAQGQLIAFPVDKKNQDKLTFVQLDYQVNSLGFNLLEKEKFFAGFDGAVEVIEGVPNQRLIVLTAKDGKHSLRYLFSGTATISNHTVVKKGQELGTVARDPLPTRDINLAVQYFQGTTPISLSKENLSLIL